MGFGEDGRYLAARYRASRLQARRYLCSRPRQVPIVAQNPQLGRGKVIAGRIGFLLLALLAMRVRAPRA